MTINAEHEPKPAALHRQRRGLHMNEKFYRWKKVTNKNISINRLTISFKPTGTIRLNDEV